MAKLILNSPCFAVFGGHGVLRGPGLHQPQREEVLRHEEELRQVPQHQAQLHGKAAGAHTQRLRDETSPNKTPTIVSSTKHIKKSPQKTCPEPF
jgi:hypothetical protein